MAFILNTTLTADGSTPAATIVNPNNGATPYQVFYVSGTFGGGTLTVQISHDNGTTYYTATNVAGNITFTAAGAIVLYLLSANTLTASDQVLVRATLSGATNPSLKIKIADCR